MKLIGTKLALLGMAVLAGPSSAQRPPKIDSLRIQLAVPRDSARELLGFAFMQAGLTITEATGFYLESDQGQTGDFALGNAIQRIVRANFVTLGDTTTIMLVGDEIRLDENGKQFKRLRIDNRAGGNGERVWCRMVRAAVLIDSAQVPAAALKPGKCPGAGAQR